MKRHIHSLSLVLAGAVLGGVAVSNMAGARAQEPEAEDEEDDELPADLLGKVKLMSTAWPGAEVETKILGTTKLDDVTFLMAENATGVYYLKLETVVALWPVK